MPVHSIWCGVCVPPEDIGYRVGLNSVSTGIGYRVGLNSVSFGIGYRMCLNSLSSWHRIQGRSQFC